MRLGQRFRFAIAFRYIPASIRHLLPSILIRYRESYVVITGDRNGYISCVGVSVLGFSCKGCFYGYSIELSRGVVRLIFPCVARYRASFAKVLEVSVLGPSFRRGLPFLEGFCRLEANVFRFLYYCDICAHPRRRHRNGNGR